MSGASIERTLAELVLACERARHAGAADSLVAGEEALRLLSERLILWFGEDGVRALMARAINRASVNYPVLADVRPAPLDGRQLDRLGDGDGADASESLREALVELLRNLFVLLSRLLGIDLVSRLVSQVWPESADASDDTSEMRTGPLE